jgi:hypothetical protein
MLESLRQPMPRRGAWRRSAAATGQRRRVTREPMSGTFSPRDFLSFIGPRRRATPLANPPFVAPIARPPPLLRSPRPRPRSLFFPSSRPLPARPAGVLLSGGRTDSQDRMDRIHHAACMVNEALRAGLAVDRNVLTNWARRDVLSRGGPIPCPPCGRARSGGRTDSQDRMDRIHHAACMVNVPLRGLVLDPKCLRSSFPRPPHLSADMPPARAPCGRASFRRAHGFPPWHIAL